MIIEVFNYRISPYSGNTCWKIQEQGDEASKGEWKEARYFPSTLSGAILKVRELVRMSDSSTKDVDKLVKDLKAIDTEFYAALDKINGKSPADFE